MFPSPVTVKAPPETWTMIVCHAPSAIVKPGESFSLSVVGLPLPHEASESIAT